MRLIACLIFFLHSQSRGFVFSMHFVAHVRFRCYFPGKGNFLPLAVPFIIIIIITIIIIIIISLY
jgi:hypothetical protein